MVKDIIKRSFISLITGAFLGYLVYLFMQNTIIVQGNFLDSNMLFYLLLGFGLVFFLIGFGIYPIAFKKTKATLFVLGLGFMLIGEYVLINDIQHKVYIGDFSKVFGVIITLLSFTNVLVTSKVTKKKKDSTMEVIDA